jgi:hypothetical protein
MRRLTPKVNFSPRENPLRKTIKISQIHFFTAINKDYLPAHAAELCTGVDPFLSIVRVELSRSKLNNFKRRGFRHVEEFLWTSYANVISIRVPQKKDGKKWHHYATMTKTHLEKS